MGELTKILITVKTYPTPSIKYDELVCTAGVREDGSFIRLYPINYRAKPYYEWYKKYQWIEAEIERRSQDPRPESFHPVGNIEPLGKPIGTKNNWEERKKYVLAKSTLTMCELQRQNQKNISPGIIKPHFVEDLIIEETEREFSEDYILRLKQGELFESGKRKPVEKIPYRFSYEYICEDPECKGHKQMISDWELGMLYLRMRNKFRDEKMACEKVKEKFYNVICADDRDTYFYVGTNLRYGTWIVIGTFWPPKNNQFDLPGI